MAKTSKLLFLTGAVGGVVAIVRKRGAKPTDLATKAAAQASSIADKAREAAPAPVKQAADKAADAVQSAAGAVQSKAAQSSGSGEEERRYAAPAEAGSQPPTDAGGAPSDASPVTDAPAAASDPSPSEQLATPDSPPHGDAVMPDTSADDPLVREQEQAAAADAGAIGGNVDQMAQDEPGFPDDPARRPVIEGSGDTDEQTTEEYDRELGGNRETQP